MIRNIVLISDKYRNYIGKSKISGIGNWAEAGISVGFDQSEPTFYTECTKTSFITGKQYRPNVTDWHINSRTIAFFVFSSTAKRGR